MSSSSSNQQSTYNTSTSYEYNTLDGGAIKEAFDFASDQSRWAFDFGNNTVTGMENVTSDALSSMEAALGMSFMWANGIAGEAFDSIDNMAANHNEQINGMANLAKSIQTQGATELINATASQNKTMYTTIAVVIIAFLILLFVSSRSKK